MEIVRLRETLARLTEHIMKERRLFVSSAEHAEPRHVFQPVKGSLRTELQIWTSAGRLIQSAPWAHTGVSAEGVGMENLTDCF